jgi:hypothetical protein
LSNHSAILGEPRETSVDDLRRSETMQTREKPANALRAAIESARPHLEAGLADAEEELRLLEQRRSELLDLIGRARAALGDTTSRTSRRLGGRMTLHDAMAQVLYESGNEWMTVREVADRINAERMYEKRDGGGADASHIHARAKQYRAMFEKDGARVRLRLADES